METAVVQGSAEPWHADGDLPGTPGQRGEILGMNLAWPPNRRHEPMHPVDTAHAYRAAPDAASGTVATPEGRSHEFRWPSPVTVHIPERQETRLHDTESWYSQGYPQNLSPNTAPSSSFSFPSQHTPHGFSTSGPRMNVENHDDGRDERLQHGGGQEEHFWDNPPSDPEGFSVSAPFTNFSHLLPGNSPEIHQDTEQTSETSRMHYDYRQGSEFYDNRNHER